MNHIFISIGATSIGEVKPVINQGGKPRGGFWSSPLTSGKYVSAWHEWCTSEMPEWISNNAVVFMIKDNARILILDDYDQAKDMLKDYTHSPYGIATMQYPNYEKLAIDYDGVFMTSKCADKAYDESFLYGWDVESLVLFNFNCIEEWDHITLDIVK